MNINLNKFIYVTGMTDTCSEIGKPITFNEEKILLNLSNICVIKPSGLAHKLTRVDLVDKRYYYLKETIEEIKELINKVE